MIKMKMRKFKLSLLPLAVMMILSLIYACENGNIEPSSGRGPYQVTQEYNTGPAGTSGLFYPANVNGGDKLPIFVWGCGGALIPRIYNNLGIHVASYGFVVISQVSTSTGNELKRALDWLLKENDRSGSPLYQKLDTGKIAAGGHSLGSVSTFGMADDPRLTTTVHVAGGSLDAKGGGTKNLRNPTAYLCGENDQFGATENAVIDYEVTTVPVYFGIMKGTGHLDAPPTSLAALISWLRWHLKGEEALADEFLNSNGAFQTGKWQAQTKNW